MNVSCPQCQTTYRVDPNKVPAGGVRARCAECDAVFPVRVETEAAPAPEPAPPPAPHPAPAPDTSPDTNWLPEVGEAPAVAEEPTAEPFAAAAAEPVGGAQVEEAPLPPAAAEEPGPEPAEPAPSPPVFAPPAGPSFGASDPHSKARRLARALVSDIVVYHPERRERSLADGTLRQEFRDEIQKSWEEYAEQVGPAFARETPYFREALNEILANGARLF